MNLNAYRILLCLLAEPQAAADLLERIARLDPEGAPPIATLYRDLNRLLQAGSVGTVEQSAGEGPGRPSQLYSITRAGRLAVRQEARRLQRLAAAGLAEGMSGNTKGR